ncbi:hypothetical protein HYDPIDRAFT_107599 [Hydnomerulius pinastri MD-312]|nr:hypothetical protein HYDPIDRAFT_107599 [Hydnomerulius pinastri MD-312]
MVSALAGSRGRLVLSFAGLLAAWWTGISELSVCLMDYIWMRYVLHQFWEEVYNV